MQQQHALTIFVQNEILIFSSIHVALTKTWLYVMDNSFVSLLNEAPQQQIK